MKAILDTRSWLESLRSFKNNAGKKACRGRGRQDQVTFVEKVSQAERTVLASLLQSPSDFCSR